MTEFEQQVADALDAAIGGDVADARTGGRQTTGEMLAPRVAAAIEAVVAELADTSEGLAAELGAGSDDVRPQVRQAAQVIALAALRGET